MTLFRHHRGSYHDSMATVVEVASMDALTKLLADTFNLPVSAGDVDVERYSDVPDERNGWTTYIVLLNRWAIGFTDGPVEP